MKSLEVRSQLVNALRLDLVGPDPTRKLGVPDEILPQSPSRWYLTGFLVPLDADDDQRAEETSVDEMDEAGDAKGADDGSAAEPAAARLAYMPSSNGLSVLVPASAQGTADHRPVGRLPPGAVTLTGKAGRYVGIGLPRQEGVAFDLPDKTPQPIEKDVPNSKGLKAVLSVRPVASDGQEGGLPPGVRSVSVFLVNRRTPAPDVIRDEAFAFQTQLDVFCDAPLVPRPNLRCLESDDWDERVADLQYRDCLRVRRWA